VVFAASPQARIWRRKRSAGQRLAGSAGSRKATARRCPFGRGEVQHQPTGPATISGNSSGSLCWNRACSASIGGPMRRRRRGNTPVRPAASASRRVSKRWVPASVSIWTVQPVGARSMPSRRAGWKTMAPRARAAPASAASNAPRSTVKPWDLVSSARNWRPPPAQSTQRPAKRRCGTDCGISARPR
jgi:hypothetical protein